MQPGVGTPTGEALQSALDGLPDFNAMLDAAASAPIIILATGGEPNGCLGMSAATCDWVGDLANCITATASAPTNYDSTLAAVHSAHRVQAVSQADDPDRNLLVLPQ